MSIANVSFVTTVWGGATKRDAGSGSAAPEAALASEVPRPDGEGKDSDQSSVASSEDFSDISDDSDMFHLTVDPDKTWCTEQDRDHERICFVASLLRKNPLLPPDPADLTGQTDWNDVQSGIALP